MIRIAFEYLIDELEQLALFTSREHAFDDRRKNANCFVYFAGLDIKTRDGKELRVVRRVLRHEHRRGAFCSSGIFSFEICTSEHRYQLVVIFTTLNNTLQHLCGFIGCASRDMRFEHATQRFAIISHQFQRVVVSFESSVLYAGLVKTICGLHKRSGRILAHVLFEIAVGEF